MSVRNYNQHIGKYGLLESIVNLSASNREVDIGRVKINTLQISNVGFPVVL